MNRPVEAREKAVAERPVIAAPAPKIAVIITASERPEHVRQVYEECRLAFDESAHEARFVLVADPWARSLLKPLEERRSADDRLQILTAGQAVGETALLRSAVDVVDADIVVTLPGYHRVSASVLPELVDRVLAGADMAIARRWPRTDPLPNRLQTRIFHFVLRGLTDTDLTDVASGVRAIRAELLEQLPAYGDLGRFLPVFAIRQGYRVVEVEAEQHPLDRGAHVYSPGVYIRRALDLFGLYFLTRFTEKPLRFFGLFGAGFAGLGGIILAVLGIQRLQGQPLADRPLLLLGLLLLVLGVQAIALGLVGEIVVHLQAASRKPYRLADGIKQPAGSTTEE